jgi:hypothetical protein
VAPGGGGSRRLVAGEDRPEQVPVFLDMAGYVGESVDVQVPEALGEVVVHLGGGGEEVVVGGGVDRSMDGGVEFDGLAGAGPLYPVEQAAELRPIAIGGPRCRPRRGQIPPAPP